MNDRNELKARMSAALGMDAETCAWIAETVRRMYAAEVEQEVAYFRNLRAV